jgi:hypothetical protein
MLRALPKKASELGRIRIGDLEPNKKGGGTHPRKLENFRLTSNNKPLLHLAANLYGGEVQDWPEAPTTGQWELYTTTNSLDVLIPTFSAITISYEVWSGGGCQRRCNGERITHCPLDEDQIGRDCVCPADEQERGKLAQDGKACARILRLNVILPDLPGTGVWRLDTKGFYATAELLGTLDMLKEAGAEHMMIEALLRLEQRSVKRVVGGQPKSTTLKFAVPTLWPKYTFRQIASAGAARGLLMTASTMDVQAKTLAQHVGDVYGDDAQDVLERTLGPGERGASDPAPPRLGSTEFALRLDAIYEAGGLTPEERDLQWTRLTRRCGDPIPEKWYASLLKDQAEWVEKRQALTASRETGPHAGARSLSPGGDPATGELFNHEESAARDWEAVEKTD